MMMADGTRKGGDAAGFGLYVHWPFCLSKCPYCDFNSHVAAGIDADDWARGYEAALAWFAEQTPGRTVSSVFFGGGTPSLMPPELVERVLETSARLWSFTSDAEITLEANPTSAEADRFRDFAAAGVNRLSLGVQALDDTALKALGREHSVKEALAAWEMAQAAFPRASLDLIYARPGQGMSDWERELGRALKLGARHMSAYQLTMEPETPFYRRHERGELELPGEEASVALYELTRGMMADAGLALYEISNYAAPGEECRHNLLYWRYGEYAGIGPGAHSRLARAGNRRLALTAVRSPARWLTQALRGNAGVVESETLTPAEAGAEYLLMSLRLAEGADLKRHAALAGATLDENTVARLVAQGLLRHSGPGRVAVTNSGRLLLDHVVAQLAG